MNIEELRQKMIEIAKSFDEWLEETAKQYEMPKDDVQSLIKQFLQG